MNNCEAIITVDAANVRSTPNATASIVGIATRGMRLPVFERTAAVQSDGFFWFNVELTANNLRGWLRADLIQLAGGCSDTNTVTTTPEVSTIGTPSLPPGLSPAVPTNPTTVLPPGLSPATPTNEETVVLIGDCVATITVFMATVRSDPSLSGSIQGFLARNATFAIIDISEEDDNGFRWYSLEFNGGQGWVREDLVNETGDCLDPHTHIDPTPPDSIVITPDPITPTPPTTQPCVAQTGLSSASVRALPTVNSDRLGTITNTQQLPVRNVTEPQSDGFRWVEITFNGQAGFVRGDLVSLIGDCSAFNNTGLLPRPISGIITQGFRPPTNPSHSGIDIGTDGNFLKLITPIPAMVDRAMTCANCQGNPPNIFTNDPVEISRIFNDADWGFGYGNHIILRFDFDDLPSVAQEQMLRAGATSSMSVFALYAHLSEMRVSLGLTIAAGMVFGVTGNTGFSQAPHLHLEVGFGTSWGTATKVHPQNLFALN